jgi:hypothetical protein
MESADGIRLFYVVGDPNAALDASSGRRRVVTSKSELKKYVKRDPVFRFIECNNEAQALVYQKHGWSAATPKAHKKQDQHSSAQRGILLRSPQVPEASRHATASTIHASPKPSRKHAREDTDDHIEPAGKVGRTLLSPNRPGPGGTSAMPNSPHAASMHTVAASVAAVSPSKPARPSGRMHDDPATQCRQWLTTARASYMPVQTLTKHNQLHFLVDVATSSTFKRVMWTDLVMLTSHVVQDTYSDNFNLVQQALCAILRFVKTQIDSKQDWQRIATSERIPIYIVLPNRLYKDITDADAHLDAWTRKIAAENILDDDDDPMAPSALVSAPSIGTATHSFDLSTQFLLRSRLEAAIADTHYLAYRWIADEHDLAVCATKILAHTR